MLHTKFRENLPAGSGEDFLRVFIIYAVADPEGVQRVRSNPPLELNYFIFMGNFRKNEAKLRNRIPLSEFEPPIQKSWIHSCIWVWRPSWLFNPDAANKISFPLPNEAPHKIWL